MLSDANVCVCTMYVCCVVDSFVNSQEWTLSRSVPDLKLVSFSILRYSLQLVFIFVLSLSVQPCQN